MFARHHWKNKLTPINIVASIHQLVFIYRYPPWIGQDLPVVDYDTMWHELLIDLLWGIYPRWHNSAEM